MIWIVAGALAVAVTLGDVVWTTLAPAAGAGPITGTIGRTGWWLVTRSAPGHRRLQLTGYATLLAVLAFWIGGVWLGWALVFHGSTDAVVDAATGQPAGSMARVAFAAGSIAGAGAGYTAGSGPWELANNVSALLGLAEFTLAVTYLFQVVTATSHKRAVAQVLNGLGDTPSRLAAASRDDSSMGATGDQLANLTLDVALLARQHRSLPVLHYLHSGERHAAIELAIARLDDALTIAEANDADPGITRPLRAIITDYLESVPVHVDAGPPPPPSSPHVGHPERVVVDAERRARLHELVIQNGWRWRDVDRDS